MSQSQPPTSLTLYRLTNPETTCDFPFLAVDEERSVLLSVGDYRLSIERSIGEEALGWLDNDFKMTGEVFVADFSMLWHVFAAVFASGVNFGLVAFDAELRPIHLGLSLAAQSSAEDSPEYLIEGRGNYQRSYQSDPARREVTVAERAMLDVCISTFQELAAHCGVKLREPPPRYHSSSS